MIRAFGVLPAGGPRCLFSNAVFFVPRCGISKILLFLLAISLFIDYNITVYFDTIKYLQEKETKHERLFIIHLSSFIFEG